MNNDFVFHERLIKAIEQSNKSTNCIEKELGYTRNALHNYKNGGEPSGRRLVELAHYFKLTPEYLIGKSDDSSPICPEHIFTLLGEEQKIQMLKLSLDWANTVFNSFKYK